MNHDLLTEGQMAQMRKPYRLTLKPHRVRNVPHVDEGATSLALSCFELVSDSINKNLQTMTDIMMHQFNGVVFTLFSKERSN